MNKNLRGAAEDFSYSKVCPKQITGTGQVIGWPNEGIGDRALNCDQYESCLSFAAAKDWDAFNCENCTYKKRGKINFIYKEFSDIVDEDESLEQVAYDLGDLGISMEYQGCHYENNLLELIEREENE